MPRTESTAFSSPELSPYATDPEPSVRTVRWQQSILEARHRLEAGSSTPNRARGELWLALNLAIQRYLRYHAQCLGPLSTADIEDIASEKSLDLFEKIESGTWDVGGRPDDEIAGFLSRVAKNGAVDLLRRRQRHREIEVELEREPDAVRRGGSTGHQSPDAGLQRRRFVEALRECATQLPPRSRQAWFLRVFYGFSSREIARHPEVAMPWTGVDMMLNRTRQKLRTCMEGKGLGQTEMPPGTFVEIWQLLKSQEEERATPHDEPAADTPA